MAQIIISAALNAQTLLADVGAGRLNSYLLQAISHAGMARSGASTQCAECNGTGTILAIEPATTDDQPIDRFLDPSDFRA